MMKFYLMLIFSMGLFFFFNKFNKLIICKILMFMMFFLNIYSSNMFIGGLNLFYLDYYSFYLILFSLWIFGCIMMIKLSKFLEFMSFLLMLVLVFCFSSLNLMFFYLMFEFSLLPIFFLIMYGGYTYERLEAMLYMLMYTVVSSMPFLLLMLHIYYNYNSLMMVFLMFKCLKLINGLMILMLILGFLVKIPMFIFHIWLPKAHVEAPVYGSMILAGVLLKLGSYGVLRLLQFFFFDIKSWNCFIISLMIIGGIFVSGMCLIQVDLKLLVAYSSVVHMGLMMGGMLTLTKMGLIGSLMMMLAHGLCSSGLFYLVNLNYECVGSRLLLLNKGSMMVNPSLGMFWFMLCSANLSAPISLNLVSEIFLLISLVCWNLNLMIYLMIMCFLSATYSLYLFSYSQHGSLKSLLMNYKIINLMNYYMLFLHLFPLNMLFLVLILFMN